MNSKGLFLLLRLATCCVGYVILLCAHSAKVKLFATCLITSGVFPSVTLLGAWTAINTGGFTKRAVTWGIAEVVGQSFSIMASHIYTDPPQYIQGHSIVLSFQLLAILATIANWFWMRHLNRHKEEELRRHEQDGTVDPTAHLSLEEAYDYHPSFRYVL
jgi:hypothetical protein